MTTMSPSTSRLGSPDPFQQDLSWLSQLPSQAIFSSSSSSSASSGRASMVLRGSDVIVLVDGQLRLMNLTSLKSAGMQQRSYKVLSNPVLEAALSQPSAAKAQISLNPSKKLLLVSSPSSMVLVILPRATSMSTNLSGSIPVKAHKVGSFYYNRDTPRIEQVAQTQWHPWSKRSSSLLVLQRCGLLQEFDVARDTAEPQQSLQLLPERKSISSPRIGFSRRLADLTISDDESEEDSQAVSFTLGLDTRSSETSTSAPGPIDWTPLTIYVLTKGNDLWAVAPFLPSSAQVPVSYLHALSSFVQSMMDSGASSSRDAGIATRYVSNLLKQAKGFQDSRLGAIRSCDDVGQIGSPFAQRRSVRSRSVMSMSVDPIGDETVNSERGYGDDEDAVEFVEVTAPSVPIVPGSIEPQGPFLLTPAPHEVSDSRESQGSQVSYVRIPATSDQATDLELLILASDDGKVDIGVLNLSTTILPRWASKQEETVGALSRRTMMLTLAKQRAGRFGLDDSSGSEDEAGPDLHSAATISPSLFIYETIDLGFPESGPSSMQLPQLTQDPLYPDVLYIRHDFGVHSISLAKWSTKLAVALEEADTEDVRALLQRIHESETTWLMSIDGSGGGRKGVASVEVVDDIYLGYSLLALLGDGDCLGLELKLRSGSSDATSSRTNDNGALAAAATDSQGKPLYVSLLEAEPYKAPAMFQPSKVSNFSSLALSASERSITKQGLKVTPETLRLFGNVVQSLDSKVQEVSKGGNALSRHLDLETQELQRQIKRLQAIQQRIDSLNQGPSSSSSTGSSSIPLRIRSALTKQSALIQRADKVLQRTMASSGLEMSDFEEAFLKELLTTEKAVGRQEDQGLRAQVAKLQSHLSSLRSEINATTQLSSPSPSSTSTSVDVTSPSPRSQPHQLGTRQLDKILSTLKAESDRLAEAKDKIQELQSTLGGVDLP